MSDLHHVLHVEQLADEVVAEHRAKFAHHDSEQFEQSSYPGLRSNLHVKYSGCEHVRKHGQLIRKLSAYEIAELHRHIARLKGELVAAPMTRKAIV